MSSTEPTLMSWSGGKDSSLALQALKADRRFEVIGLLTSITREYERVSIHGVRRELLEQQARAIGLPLYEISLEPASSNAAYESAFRTAVEAVRSGEPQLQTIAFGDLFLEDVRAYRERLLAGMELKGHYPLWGMETKALAREFIASGFRARLVCVDTQQLSASFAGREFDEMFLAELPDAVDQCGEGGEFHTFVYDGPLFSHPVGVNSGETVMRESRFAYTDLLPGAGLTTDPS